MEWKKLSIEFYVFYYRQIIFCIYRYLVYFYCKICYIRYRKNWQPWTMPLLEPAEKQPEPKLLGRTSGSALSFKGFVPSSELLTLREGSGCGTTHGHGSSFKTYLFNLTASHDMVRIKAVSLSLNQAA